MVLVLLCGIFKQRPVYATENVQQQYTDTVRLVLWRKAGDSFTVPLRRRRRGIPDRTVFEVPSSSFFFSFTHYPLVSGQIDRGAVGARETRNNNARSEIRMVCNEW